MTKTIDVVEKSTMDKIYEKADILRMIKEVRAITGWSRDECMRQAGVKLQAGKDWYRKDRDHQPTHADIVRIVNIWEKKLNKLSTPLVSARNKLNSAILLWLQDADEDSVRQLAFTAYDMIQSEIPAREAKEDTKGETSIITGESLIFGSIIGLQLLGEALTSNESSFYRWYLIQNSKLLAKNDREVLMQLLPANSNGNIGSLKKADFFGTAR